MLSDPELESLLKDGKSDRERKASLRDKEEIRKAVCDFARSAQSEASGVVFVVPFQAMSGTSAIRRTLRSF
jgi:hypothetical protein